MKKIDIYNPEIEFSDKHRTPPHMIDTQRFSSRSTCANMIKKNYLHHDIKKKNVANIFFPLSVV
jgi:hypothetical protein